MASTFPPLKSLMVDYSVVSEAQRQGVDVSHCATLATVCDYPYRKPVQKLLVALLKNEGGDQNQACALAIEHLNGDERQSLIVFHRVAAVNLEQIARDCINMAKVLRAREKKAWEFADLVEKRRKEAP